MGMVGRCAKSNAADFRASKLKFEENLDMRLELRDAPKDDGVKAEPRAAERPAAAYEATRLDGGALTVFK